jgi:hypothetical protein
MTITYQEILMNQPTENQRHKPEQIIPSTSTLDETTRQKLKAEEREVAGRHKNDGQKDHKGAR